MWKKRGPKLISVKKANIIKSEMTNAMDEFAITVAHDAFDTYTADAKAAEYITDKFNAKYG